MFPLNVYSALMRLHAGQVPFLSYGDLSEADVLALDSSAAGARPARLAALLIDAQWRRADQILSRILPPSARQQAVVISAAANNAMAKNAVAKKAEHNGDAKSPQPFVVSDHSNHLRVLDVGCGSGELARMLAERGFDVCAVDNTPAVMSLALADDPVPGSLEFIACDFKEFEDQRGFDLLIFNNSTRYFLPLTMFYKAQTLLRPGGQLLICEEFSDNTAGEADPDSLPVQNHVLALAQRLGFELLSVDDLTESTARFQQIFARLFGSSLAELPTLADVPAGVIDNLYQDLQADTLAAEQGKRRHALISLRAAADAVSTITGAVYLRSAADLAPSAFRKVFERSFEVDFAGDLWAWKYGDGRGASVVAERNGDAIAHYGGVVRNIHYFGKPCRAVQICDVMVIPDERSFFSRNTLFFKTAASMLEQYVGYRAQNLLGFGFPNIKAMHIAERLGLYEKTDELMQIALATGSPVKPPHEWVVETMELESLLPLANLLWAKMSPAFSDAIIGVRDADYLHYRFAQRPGLDYECLKVSVNGGVKALAFRRPHYDGYLVMDVIADAPDLPMALQAILRPSDSGKPSVFWLTAGQLDRVQRGSKNLMITKTGIQIPCNCWSRGPATARLAGKWWLTAGDMDFL